MLPKLSAPSFKSASSMWMLAAVLLSLSLTACKPKDVKPSLAPEVRCQQPRTAGIPDWPTDWLADGPSYTITLLGIITEERRLEGVEGECLGRLRKAGVIR